MAYDALHGHERIELARWIRALCASEGIVVDEVSVYSHGDFWSQPTISAKFEMVADQIPKNVPAMAEVRRMGLGLPFDINRLLTLGVQVMLRRFATVGMAASVKATRTRFLGDDKERQVVVMVVRTSLRRLQELGPLGRRVRDLT